MLKHFFPSLIAFFFFSAFVFSATEDDIRFLQGLDARNLFESIDYFCSREFKKEARSQRDKDLLASQLVRSRTRQMLFADSGKRNDLRNSLADLEARFSTVSDEFPSNDAMLARLSLQFQFAIVDYSLGDWLRLEADVAAPGDREPQTARARKTLLDAKDKLNRCRDDLVMLRNKTESNADRVFEQKSLALERSILFQLALTQIAYAATFSDGVAPEDTENRSLGLNEAVDFLVRIAGLQIDDPIVLHSRIELASCYRRLGDPDRCREILDTLNTGKTAADIRVQTELIRFRIASGEIERAAERFQSGHPDSANYPDFDLARIELFQALENRFPSPSPSEFPQNATEKQKTEQISRSILELVRKIEEESGPYWGRRARLLLVRNATASDRVVATDPNLLALLAEDQYRAGRYSESVDLFDKAERIARLRDDPDSAFQFARSAAGVLGSVCDQLDASETVSEAEKTQCLNKTIESLRQLALRFFARKESPELHLKAVDLAAGAVLENRMPPADYLKLLKEHAVTWPHSAKGPPLLLRASLLLQQNGQIVDALALLANIPNRSIAGTEAVRSAFQCFQLLDAESGNAPKSVSWPDRARWFQQRLPRDASPWLEADALAALTSAEYWVRAASAPMSGKADAITSPIECLKNAESLIRLALERYPDASVAFKGTLSALLVTTLAEQGRQEEAAAVLRSLNDDLLENLSTPEKQTFQRTRARLLADTGKVQQAIDLLSELIREKSDEPLNWIVLGDILAKRSDDPDALAKALKIWIRIEESSEKDSETWWTARERILEILIAQGKIDEAKKSLDLLELLYPDSDRHRRMKNLKNKLLTIR